MKRIDDRVIALFDRRTTAVQRRAWLPLNTLIMGTECLFWATAIAASRLAEADWFLYVVAALSLAMGFVRWQNAHGYWDNHRKAQELNARVLQARDHWRFRFGVTALVLCFGLPIDVVIWRLAGIVNDIALFCLMYAYCCRYLGPGDFAREKRESLSGALQEG